MVVLLLGVVVVALDEVAALEAEVEVDTFLLYVVVPLDVEDVVAPRVDEEMLVVPVVVN